MSITSKPFYNVKCDICGATDGTDWFEDPQDVRIELENGSDWLSVEGRDICPDCYSFDDDDNFVLKDGTMYDCNLKPLAKKWCPDCMVAQYPACDKGIPCCHCDAKDCNSRQPCPKKGAES